MPSRRSKRSRPKKSRNKTRYRASNAAVIRPPVAAPPRAARQGAGNAFPAPAIQPPVVAADLTAMADPVRQDVVTNGLTPAQRQAIQNTFVHGAGGGPVPAEPRYRAKAESISREQLLQYMLTIMLFLKRNDLWFPQLTISSLTHNSNSSNLRTFVGWFKNLAAIIARFNGRNVTHWTAENDEQVRSWIHDSIMAELTNSPSDMATRLFLLYEQRIGDLPEFDDWAAAWVKDRSKRLPEFLS